ncbi:unnamed protein product [Mytilus edulis]|uniref:Uncharacterized protein n=1 Tax=Mytilus edulis TaxID=6550 RepID=A0A8S3VER2_MYTED|nr:unnamed protein product [Mytilus edulis]
MVQKLHAYQILLSFRLQFSHRKKLSAEELVVLAIVRSSEKYENLEECLSQVFSEINEMYSCKNIQVDSKLYNLAIFFGGDMKFIQICLGLVSSTGQYACHWCKVHKQDRGDVSKPWNFYHLNENVRTTSEIKEIYMGTLKPNYGVKHLPFMTIEPVHTIPDELHLFMRIFDFLMRNLIDDVIEKDDKAKLKGENGGYLDSLVKSIRDCGVTLSLWTSQGRGDLEWTSLTGTEMKRRNHHDCAIDAMKVQKRLELIVNSGRSKRKYRKTDDQFWENGKQEIQVRKRRQILQEMEKASTVHNKQKFPDLHKMTDIEIKQKLKDGGINTRVRKREKLVEMLKKVLLSD